MSQSETISSVCFESIRVRGLVQGVGFRPTVYRLALENDIRGEVLNDGEGVLIHALADASMLDRFVEQLKNHPPKLARIESIERSRLDEYVDFSSFNIVGSNQTDVHTGIVADAATCPDCVADITDPDNHRFGYAFTNCTHCGPRLSIVQDIPYDRAKTSMAPFTMCPSCQREYDHPLDRRFHAQPNACPDCGPVLQLVDNQGNPLASADPIRTAAMLLQQGKILAIKGIGGFQLACDAANDAAVIDLRRRKQRPAKAFALMARDCVQLREYCALSTTEQQELESPAAPIMILQQHKGAASLSSHLAPDQHTLGFMLPYSPLHHLLLEKLEQPLVMTSGNASNQPQCIDNPQALQDLGRVADYFLWHNRDIVNRIDDSVLRLIDDEPQFYRRARGYAPVPVRLPDDLACNRAVLACGAELKNTFALLRDNQVTLSQHMGNLENLQTWQDYLKNLDLFRKLFRFEPGAIVVDRHPEYLSSKWGREYAQDHDLPIIEVQHHHAHIAACLADNGWSAQQGPVLGVALDGLGLGDDGSLWGGEFMLADYRQYQRLGHFRPAPLPGGVQAMLEPWRNLLAQLLIDQRWADLDQHHGELDLVQYLAGKPVATLERMIDKGIQSPPSSSCGRLFDAVAAALGLSRDKISYEGQAAMQLEALITPQSLEKSTPYPFEIDHAECLQFNPRPMWQALLHDVQQQVDRSRIAARFHLTIAHACVAILRKLGKQTGIRTVALSGGVFQNATLLVLISDLLRAQGFNLLKHRQVPANDGGLSLGQAAIAAARLSTGDF